MLVWLGLFGLVASLHGIIMGYGRQIFALARAGFLPAVLGKLHPRFKTPYTATLAGGSIGIAAIFSDDIISINGQSLTATLVTMSVFGALTMYLLSMIDLEEDGQLPTLSRSFNSTFASSETYTPTLACQLSNAETDGWKSPTSRTSKW